MHTTITSNHVSAKSRLDDVQATCRKVAAFQLGCLTVSLLAYLALSQSIRTFVREFTRLVGKTF